MRFASARSSASASRCSVDRDPELHVDALGRRETVSAQVARGPCSAKRREIRIERRVAFGAGRHGAVAEQGMHFGATERQRRRQRALERRPRGHTSRSTWPSAHEARPGAPARADCHSSASGGDQRPPVRIGASAGVVPAPRQPRGAPERGKCRMPSLHARTESAARPARASSIRRTNSSGSRQLGERAPGAMRLELVERSIRPSPRRRCSHRSRWRTGYREGYRRRRRHPDRRPDPRASPARARAQQLSSASPASSAKAPSGKVSEQVVVRELGARATARVAGEQIRAHIGPLPRAARESRARSAARVPASSAALPAAAPRSASPSGGSWSSSTSTPSISNVRTAI